MLDLLLVLVVLPQGKQRYWPPALLSLQSFKIHLQSPTCRPGAAILCSIRPQLKGDRLKVPLHLTNQ
jgi:hypothetical protein